MTTVKLDARLTADHAAPLRDSLLSHRGGALTLDAGEVERLGGPCFQVLAAARKTWAADGQTLIFAQPSPAFTAGLAILGASDWIQEDIAS
jgi:chemotaxis protein CheX